eukprot:gb/GEZN01009218.1/.p1 GENE.gb/GEZN01009218.1/~~gb/GEZN01009218.1/.p1  ORF type:complete len:253 (-),score=26.86 gb/GEZN01009218.1/:328-1086(-)
MSNARESKRLKHNDAEKQRRQKIKSIFDELASLVGCARPQQSAILRVAIDKVRILQREMDDLSKQNAELRQLPLRSSSSCSSSSTEVPQGDESGSPISETGGSPSPSMIPIADALTRPPVVSMGHDDIFLCSSLPMVASNVQGHLLDCNPPFCKLLMRSRDSLLNAQATIFDLTHPDSFAGSFAFISDILNESERVHTITKRYLCAQGGSVLVKQSSWLCHDQQHLPSIIMSVFMRLEEPLAATTDSEAGRP